MLFPINGSIWFYPEPVDFHKQINGLMIMVSDHLEMNPTSGQLFLFRDRTAKKIKILWWDRNGFWLMYKRLEKSKLKFPPSKNGVMELTRDQFHWLLSGLDCLTHTVLPEVKASNFY